MNPRPRILMLCCLVFLLSAPAASAAAPARPWMLRTNLVAISQSVDSHPGPGEDKLRAHRTFALDVAIRRSFNGPWAAEFIGGIHSQEVSDVRARGSIGSLASLPMTLLMQWHPVPGGFMHPYAGAGVNITAFWGKSAELDYMDIGPTVGPAVQLGTDIDLSRSAALNVDVGWHASRTEWSYATEAASGYYGQTGHAELKMHPFHFGAGIGFRF